MLKHYNGKTLTKLILKFRDESEMEYEMYLDHSRIPEEMLFHFGAFLESYTILED